MINSGQSAKQIKFFYFYAFVAVLSISFVLTSCSVSDLTTIHEKIKETDSMSSTDANSTESKITIEQFVKESILPNYDEISTGFCFELEQNKNQLIFDCNNFKNAIVGWIVCDINNDGENDILTITLEKHNRKFDEDKEIDTIFVSRTPYIYEDGNYIKHTGWSKRLLEYYLSISEHLSMVYKYANLLDAGNTNYLAESITIENDTAIYNEKDPPYYSAENSLGDYETFMTLEKYEGNDFKTLLGYQERISHVRCMPEAEHISYYDTKNVENLFSSGVTGVTTGTNMPAPEFKYETSGKFNSEDQAIEYINQSLFEYGMEKYKLSTHSWDDRYNNSFVLDEPKNKSCAFKLTGVTVNETRYRCFVELI